MQGEERISVQLGGGAGAHTSTVMTCYVLVSGPDHVTCNMQTETGKAPSNLAPLSDHSLWYENDYSFSRNKLNNFFRAILMVLTSLIFIFI